MPVLIITLFIIALPLAKKTIPELEPFDDSDFDAAFDRLRGRKARAVGQLSDQLSTPSRIPFVGALIKRLPGKRSENAESTEK
ncbi:hypothetical protein K2Z83_18525 [Oscillochloris sp. ZM17-4]|uniref:hypothetical protein n=1 Tax=Oscillochloris sp. ZM17-4 TaxID=2866714 RepID=UPI001C739DC3|nr:hypothetical protein [Oscillochloris sp. ZM17-4]MBX0329669.1 hypothetical protein [Oscillochloris sp. ZM17-4]